MESIVLISDIVNIIKKKIKLILTITLVGTLFIVVGSFFMNTNKDAELYEIKISGIKNYVEMNDMVRYDVLLEANTVDEFYQSEAIKTALYNLDSTKLSEQFIQSTLPQYDGSEEAKKQLANRVFTMFEVKTSGNSRIFTLTFSKADQDTAVYLARYIFNAGANLINMNSKYVSVTEIAMSQKAISSGWSTPKVAAASFVGIFILSCMCVILYKLLRQVIISKNQMKDRYDYDILKNIKSSNDDLGDLAAIVEYRLKSSMVKVMVFLFEQGAQNSNILKKIQKNMQESGKSVAIIRTNASGDDTGDEGIFYYDNIVKTEEENKKIWLQIEAYDYILIETSTDTLEKILFTHKNIIIVVQSGITSFRKVDETIEKIAIFDGLMEGFVLLK